MAVITTRGKCEILDPSNLPPDEEPVVEEAPAMPESSRYRSPDGYSITIPAGWEASDRLSSGDVSLGLGPSESTARMKFPNAPQAALRELLRGGSMLITVIPAGGESGSNLALSYLMREQDRARTGGYRLGPPSVTKPLVGGRDWTQVDLRKDREVAGDSWTLHKVALVHVLPGDRAVWIELLVPEGLHDGCVADLMRLVGSFSPEE